MTQEEKEEIVNSVLNQIRAQANDITELETIRTLGDVKSLPAMQGESLVLVPIELLISLSSSAATSAETSAIQAKDAAVEAKNAVQRVESSLASLAKLDVIVDLGVVGGQAEAENLAAGRDITENYKARIITWRTGDDVGDGSVILQSRWGTYYVCQTEMFVGQDRAVRYRLITTGGNYSVGDWKELIVPNYVNLNGSKEVIYMGIRPGIQKKLFTVPSASTSGFGLVKIGDYMKKDGVSGALTIDVPSLKTALGI